MKQLQIFFVLSLTAAVACEKPPSPEEAGSAKIAADSGAEASSESSVDAAHDGTDTARAVVEPPPTPLVAPTLSRAVRAKDVADLVGDEPHGTLSGEAFGEDSELYGIARNECGDGTVLRPIFKRAGASALEVGPPIPLEFYNLATGRPVTYEENDFRVTVDVAVDTPKRFDGEVRITYQRLGKERVFAHLTYDGPPTDAVVPPQLEGEGKLVQYPNCYPSGYAQLTTSDGEMVQGLVRIVDIEGKGAAYAKVTVGSATALQVLVVSRDPKKGIDPATTIPLAAARRTDGDVGILFDISHRPELTSPDEAIGSNLGTLQKSKVLEGEATVRIWRERGKRFFEGTFEDVQISEIIEGPLSGKTFEIIRIYGEMVDDDERPLELPEPPAFYKSDDEQGEAP